MPDFLRYCPADLYYGGQAKDGVISITTPTSFAAAVAPNTLILAGVSGKRIMVIGGNIYSNGAFSTIAFLSGATGAKSRASFAVPANTVATPNVRVCRFQGDWFETDTGEGLYYTNTAAICIVTLNLILYTP